MAANDHADEVLRVYPSRTLDDGWWCPATVDLQPASVRLGRVSARGVRGAVGWLADGAEPALLRLVNALAGYAAYCGTGVQTARGMGWTARISPGSRPAADGSRKDDQVGAPAVDADSAIDTDAAAQD